MEYELLFFTSVNNEDRVGEIKKDIEEILTSQGGKISADFFDIGKRKFAHPIKKQTHGFFSFCHFETEDKDKIPEIDRRLRLNDKIMRHLIVRADEIGKPVAAQAFSEEKPRERKERIPEIKKNEPVETKAKVGMEELDEKLSELLDENPE